MTKRVLLLKPGVTSSRAVLGDYEAWFSRATGGASMHPVELHAGERPPAVDGFDAVIMTGSPLSVTQPTEWMERAADPVLGVCFGHQLLAWRHGARVVRNPQGRELGTVFVELTAAGRSCPLLGALPPRFDVQATHEDMVVKGDAPLEVLATNEKCALQAFSVGRQAWGVQFHPEMDAASIAFCIDSKDTRAEDRRGAVARETAWGARLLQRFVELA
ncbi:MAG: glutamine amidotransferase-related protein [Myxococcota bacterium]